MEGDGHAIARASSSELSGTITTNKTHKPLRVAAPGKRSDLLSVFRVVTLKTCLCSGASIRTMAAPIIAAEHNTWVQQKDEAARLRLSGALQEALATAKACAEKAELWGRRDLEAAALCEMGTVLEAMGQHQRAIACFEQHVAIADETGDEESGLIARFNLGLSCLSLQQPAAAFQHFSEMLSYSQRKGNQRFEAAARVNVAMALQQTGRSQDAVSHLKKATQILQDLGDLHGQARALGTLGNSYYDSQYYRHAENTYRELIQLAQAIQDPITEGSACGEFEASEIDPHSVKACSLVLTNFGALFCFAQVSWGWYVPNCTGHQKHWKCRKGSWRSRSGAEIPSSR